MVANRRADYQRLCEELRASETIELKERLKSNIRELIAEDDSYARGFIEDSLRRALKYISPTVGRDEGRPFSLAAEVHYPQGQPVVILGVSFRPKLEDNVDELIGYFGAEIRELAALRGFDWLIAELAINGRSIAQH